MRCWRGSARIRPASRVRGRRRDRRSAARMACWVCQFMCNWHADFRCRSGRCAGFQSGHAGNAMDGHDGVRRDAQTRHGGVVASALCHASGHWYPGNDASAEAASLSLWIASFDARHDMRKGRGGRELTRLSRRSFPRWRRCTAWVASIRSAGRLRRSLRCLQGARLSLTHAVTQRPLAMIPPPPKTWRMRWGRRPPTSTQRLR